MSSNVKHKQDHRYGEYTIRQRLNAVPAQLKRTRFVAKIGNLDTQPVTDPPKRSRKSSGCNFGITGGAGATEISSIIPSCFNSESPKNPGSSEAKLRSSDEPKH
jgi:hypothetical protein